MHRGAADVGLQELHEGLIVGLAGQVGQQLSALVGGQPVDRGRDEAREPRLVAVLDAGDGRGRGSEDEHAAGRLDPRPQVLLTRGAQRPEDPVEVLDDEHKGALAEADENRGLERHDVRGAGCA